MKVLLLFPPKYGLLEGFEKAFSGKGEETRYLDFAGSLSSAERQVNTQMFRFPDRARKRWEDYFHKRINNWYIRQFESFKPDLVFVYNNQMLLPETLIWLKGRGVKIAFFLGDSPLYSHTSRYNLAVLEYADSIFVPDSFWLRQLKKTGLQNVELLLPSLPLSSYHPVTDLSADERNLLKTEVLYAGVNYNDSWGYKKSKFVNCFTDRDLKIYGNRAWKRWFDFFPGLESHFIEKNGFIPVAELNRMYNCTKIVPVDGNPGILNGMHARVIESLAAGTLPLLEWNSDMDDIFAGIDDLPAVKDYREIPGMISYYLDHESERKHVIQRMRSAYSVKYSDAAVAEVIYKSIFD